MDLSHMSGFVLIVIGAVVFVTAIMLSAFWVSEAALEAIKQRVQGKLNNMRQSLPRISVHRRKAA